jgi:hypothetical protein
MRDEGRVKMQTPIRRRWMAAVPLIPRPSPLVLHHV